MTAHLILVEQYPDRTSVSHADLISVSMRTKAERAGPNVAEFVLDAYAEETITKHYSRDDLQDMRPDLADILLDIIGPGHPKARPAPKLEPEPKVLSPAALAGLSLISDLIRDEARDLALAGRRETAAMVILDLIGETIR